MRSLQSGNINSLSPVTKNQKGMQMSVSSLKVCFSPLLLKQSAFGLDSCHFTSTPFQPQTVFYKQCITLSFLIFKLNSNILPDPMGLSDKQCCDEIN